MAKRAPKDPRSTYRKQARKVLEKLVKQELREFACEKCGHVPLPPINRSNNLDVNHKNKVLSDLDPANLEYLCRKCHYAEDRATSKGEAKQEHKDKLYGEGFFL